ncbi:hypothetical protein [Merismopedia glauca]|uniref:Uncharacterized protein n=1 Tax=Merismopedia glauca CCAP 1448/3 TaxID=1296344 RepID=A0A2T1CAI8_9CYAN|nr:hypothetical protein [Merismopedia glauca]PSB05280.1 hypothetical protein C7B64_00305 [Merismopedia glauca CCAP 1448/3]
MQCTVLSRSGQVLARGKLILHPEDRGKMRLNLQTNGGRLIEGGIVEDNGDLTSASEALFQQCYETWGMTGLTLTVTIR